MVHEAQLSLRQRVEPQEIDPEAMADAFCSLDFLEETYHPLVQRFWSVFPTIGWVGEVCAHV